MICSKENSSETKCECQKNVLEHWINRIAALYLPEIMNSARSPCPNWDDNPKRTAESSITTDRLMIISKTETAVVFVMITGVLVINTERWFICKSLIPRTWKRNVNLEKLTKDTLVGLWIDGTMFVLHGP